MIPLNCKACVYFNYSSELTNFNKDWGECHRHAPKAVYVTNGPQVIIRAGIFPMVHKYGKGCGEGDLAPTD